MFAANFAPPVTDITNTIIKQGKFPDIYKKTVTVTPVPKSFPTLKLDHFRDISNLFLVDKVVEKVVAELMVEDMKSNIDPCQYGNKKRTSIQHYLVNLIHRILTCTDNSSRGEAAAVIATIVDWKEAFPRQCPRLGVESFIRNGVRPSLIPLLVSYFQGREMRVKWQGKIWTVSKMPGSGPQGATFGLEEYLSQTNNITDCVPNKDRFRWIDDCSILEIVNLLTIGLSSYNIKYHVPNDIPVHNQYIDPEKLTSQRYLDIININTKQQKMKMNQTKTKNLIFNFSKKHQFTTRLQLNDENVQVVNQTKLLGTIICDSLSWDATIKDIVRKSYCRMEILRKISGFGASVEDMKKIYISYIRSILEQSCVVWGSSLTQENKNDLERVKKIATKLLLKEKYVDYEKSLITLDLKKLSVRRNMLALRFAKGCLKNEKMKHLFPLNTRNHKMNTRYPEKYKVLNAKTERLRKSTIPYLQNLLNKDERKNQQK